MTKEEAIELIAFLDPDHIQIYTEYDTMLKEIEKAGLITGTCEDCKHGLYKTNDGIIFCMEMSQEMAIEQCCSEWEAKND